MPFRNDTNCDWCAEHLFGDDRRKLRYKGRTFYACRDSTKPYCKARFDADGDKEYCVKQYQQGIDDLERIKHPS